MSICLRAGWIIGRVKERYLKYENAGDKLVGQTLTDIPPRSCEFGISPVYFISQATNKQQIDDFTSLVFPIQHSKLISLSRILLVTFIYYE